MENENVKIIELVKLQSVDGRSSNFIGLDDSVEFGDDGAETTDDGDSERDTVATDAQERAARQTIATDAQLRAASSIETDAQVRAAS